MVVAVVNGGSSSWYLRVRHAHLTVSLSRCGGRGNGTAKCTRAQAVVIVGGTGGGQPQGANGCGTNAVVMDKEGADVLIRWGSR